MHLTNTNSTSAAQQGTTSAQCTLPPTHGSIGACTPVGSPAFAQGKAVRRWLLHKAKQPFYVDGTPRRGELDSQEDRDRFGTYEEAIEALSTGRFDGLGFALGPDEAGGYWQGIDLDDIAENHLSHIANRLPGYVERSPSGKGCHAIGYGTAFPTLGANKTGIEAYSAGRYFTFTGDMGRGELCCLASFVASSLAPSHSARPTQVGATDESSVVVSPRVFADLRSALFSMRSDERELWVRMGMALKELGDRGRGLWLEWSAQSDSHRPGPDAKTWDGFAPHSTGYAAVFAEAQRNGWFNPSARDCNEAPSPSPSHVLQTAEEANVEWINGDWAVRKVPPRPIDSLITRTADTIAMQSLDWLWPGYLACGFLNLVVGETSAGKSTVLADITARVTRGGAWPGEDYATTHPAGRVLWLGSEDPMEILTVPRLVACGAVLAGVTEIVGVSRFGTRHSFSMQDDLLQVKHELDAAHAVGRPYAMVVIDPITSYLHGGKLRKVDMNDSGQLRTILEPWVTLASTTGIAMVGVTHLAKDTTRSLLHRVLGGGAFAQLCRSLIAVVNQPEAGQYEKAVLQVKTNLPGAPKAAWRFRTSQKVVGADRHGRPVEANFPIWGRLDPALTAEGLAGGARGPVSPHAGSFREWLRTHFEREPTAFKRVEDVKVAALNQCGFGESWWRENSSAFLEKENRGGTWMCRPRSLL